jgi:hypothetical protein
LADTISMLLADAWPTYAEIEGEPDPLKRRKRERDRDFATDRLTKMYQDAEKRGELARLDPRVGLFRNLYMGRYGDRLLKLKGGRPAKEHNRFLIAMHMLEAIERRGVEERGSVEAALRDVASLHGTTYRYVRNIYYEFYDGDPAWRRDVLLELASRDPDPERRYADLKSWAWQRRKGNEG